MTEKMTPPNLQESKTLLADLFEEVKANEGTLRGAGEENLGKGATTIQNFQITKVNFGNPRDNLISLTEEIFKERGVELTGSLQQQMRNVDFYSIRHLRNSNVLW